MERIEEGPRRILVVDGDDYVAEFFGAIFQGKGYTMQVAVDFEEAREAVEKGEYDILIFDVYLPGANGVEILREAQRAADQGKVVVLTGDVSVRLRERAAALGITRCIAKPFDLEEIREVVRMTG